MRSLFCTVLICLAAIPAASQSFPDFVIRVNIAPEQRRQYLVDSMLATIPAFPFAESDSMVWFLYKGAAQDVAVSGDMNNWNDLASPLQQLSTTDLWYRGERYAHDARLDYKFIVNGTWILDPRNPHTISGGFGPNSELRMPGYQPPPEIQRIAGVPRGTLFDTTMASPTLNNSRTVRVYLPAGYELNTARYPVVLFHDGLDYLALGSAANVLDNLIHQGRIPPCVAVFVPAVNRSPEYAGAQIDSYTDFIVNTVMHWVDTRFRTRSDPAARAVMGASNGGNISLYMAMKHPDVFGNVGAQSSNIIASITDRFEQDPVLPLRLYLDLGTFDIDMLIPMVRAFVPVLRSKGYEHHYQEFHEGHSWGNWRAHIDDALVFFFARLLSTDMPSTPEGQGFRIDPAWPNPASTQITLRFSLARGAWMRVTLHDMLGRDVGVLSDRQEAAGTGILRCTLPVLSPGLYLLRAATPTGTAVQRIAVR